MERVDGLQCSFPVDPSVTNRSQPFVVAQIERAEAEEALRTPLRPSGLLAGAAGAADAIGRNVYLASVWGGRNADCWS